MIIDLSCSLSGTSVSRLSDYLSLCKIDVLVRNAADAAPSRRVDQPSKVGQAGTITSPIPLAKSCCFTWVDFDSGLISDTLTHFFCKLVREQSGLNIKSLSGAGTIIIQHNNGDLEWIPLYTVYQCADNFATKRKARKIALAFDKQDVWVQAFLELSGSIQFHLDYLMVIYQNQIRSYKASNSNGGS